MFFFKSCCGNNTGPGYEIVTKNSSNQQVVRFVQDLNDLKPEQLVDRQSKILSVNKSEYPQLVEQYKGKKWTDPIFGPSQEHIGKIEGIKSASWKRISDILSKKPVLFDGKVEPKDVIQGSLGDCYFLSALAALAQEEQRIRIVFGNQQFNQSGIYKVKLRIDGIIEEILVDDFIPVNSSGHALFCQPNKNQFWVLILQKAWAKAHGSYANIVAGNPMQVFKAVTYAPAEMFLIKQNKEEQDKQWNKIVEYSRRDYPCCCGTDDRKMEWDKLNLVPGHAYTLIDAKNLKSKRGEIQRMMKLRNPWGKTEWKGKGSEDDKQFWEDIEYSQEKNLFLKNTVSGNDGIFFMTFEDFCTYFTQVHFSLLEQNANYITENLYPNKKNGELFELQVVKDGDYTFELHQSGIRGETVSRQEQGLSRGTILICRKDGETIQFIDGSLKFNQQDNTLKCKLKPGKYLLYAKLDPTANRKLMPQKSSISVYSIEFVSLKKVKQQQHPQFLKRAFLNYGRQRKRNQYQDGKMWIGWKLLFQQGGYAYIALGNQTENKKFVISFNEKDFNDLNFELKKPFKNKGDNLVLEVLPGKEEIILARVKNTDIKSIKFPPPLSIKIESIS